MRQATQVASQMQQPVELAIHIDESVQRSRVPRHRNDHVVHIRHRQRGQRPRRRMARAPMRMRRRPPHVRPDRPGRPPQGAVHLAE